MSLNFEVKTIQENDKDTVMIIFKNPKFLPVFIENLKRFIAEYEKFLLREKTKKEMKTGYFSISGSKGTDGNSKRNSKSISDYSEGGNRRT